MVFVILASMGVNVHAGNIGDVGTVKCSGIVKAAPNIYLYEKCSKYAFAKDDYGLNQMFRTGQCVALTVGTKVRWLKLDSVGYNHLSQVRVLDGPYVNQELWLQYGCSSFDEQPKAKKRKTK